MINKIAEALGELKEQVEAKLKESGIELAVANDGTVVPADKIDNLKADLAQKDTLVKNLQSKLEGLSKLETDNAELKKSLETASEDAKKEIKLAQESADKAVNTAIKTAVLQRQLLADKADPANVDLLLKEFDIDSLQLNEKKDGIIGYADIAEPIKAKRSVLFIKVTTEGNPPKQGQGGAQKSTKKDLIKEYEAAEARGDIMAMNRIDRQIKNLKE